MSVRKFGYLLGATALVATLGYGAPVRAEEGVTDKEIVIGLFAPLSGPLAAFGLDPLNAAKMMYDQANEKGGIHGRKIRVIIEDDKCNPNETNAVAKKLLTVDHVFMLNGGSCTGATVSIQEMVTREKVPHVMLNASGDPGVIPPTRYVFGSFPGTQGTIGAAMMGFAIDSLKAKTVAYITTDDDYGKANLGAAKALADKMGVKITATEIISAQITDVTAPLLRIRQANPDVILTSAYPTPAVLIVQKRAEYGMKQPIVQAVQGVTSSATFAKNVGDDAALADFYYSSPINDLVDGPKQAKWVEMYKKAFPERTNIGAYMAYGIPSAMAVIQALEKAGPDLTREKFVDALQTVSFDSGVMAGPIEFGANRRDAMRSQTILKFDGKKNTLMPGVYTWDGTRAN